MTRLALATILVAVFLLASAEKSPLRKALPAPCDISCLEAKNAALQRLAVKRLKGWRGSERLRLNERGRFRRTIRQLRVYGQPVVDSCLDELIERESHWNVHATNPTTGAYGLPQALPGSKMKSAGKDWKNNAATQIRWMVGYVNSKYGGSCGALSFQKANGWY